VSLNAYAPLVMAATCVFHRWGRCAQFTGIPRFCTPANSHSKAHRDAVDAAVAFSQAPWDCTT
jgi:hypothetical protein